MRYARTIKVSRPDTQCNEVTLSVSRRYGKTGVKILAFHMVEGLRCQQSRFFEMSAGAAKGFIEDYSIEQAQALVDDFSVNSLC